MVQVIDRTTPAGELSKALGRGLSGGLQGLVSQKIEDMQYEKQQQRELDQRKRDMDLAREQYQDLINRGFSEKEAALWTQFTQGGKTELAKHVLDRMHREEDLEKKGFSQEAADAGDTPKKPESGLEMLEAKETVTEEGPDDEITSMFEDITVEEDPVGRTPKEKAALAKEREARSYDRNKKYLERISERASGLQQESLALSQMRGALESGDFTSWRNALGELLPGKLGEGVKTGSAQIVNAAAKQYLMSSLKGLTGRPNQFIEQQITKALINPLYRDAANELILDGLEGLKNLSAREVEIAEQLEEKYIDAGKEIPRNFQQMVRKQLKKETDAFNKEYEQKVREKLGKQEKGVEMYDRSGKVKIVPQNQVNKAKKSGYKLKK